MPQEPKKRHSRARQGKRRAAIHFALKHAVKCPNCAALNPPHTICRSCGYYKGRNVMNKSKTKKEKPKTEESKEVIQSEVK